MAVSSFVEHLRPNTNNFNSCSAQLSLLSFVIFPGNSFYQPRIYGN